MECDIAVIPNDGSGAIEFDPIKFVARRQINSVLENS